MPVGQGLRARISSAPPFSNHALMAAPVLDWGAALGQVGDEALLVNLLVMFFGEAAAHVQHILDACRVHRGGGRSITCAGYGPRTVDEVLRDEAHAIKGSAASLALTRVSTAAREIELPMKEVLALPDGDARRAAALAAAMAPGSGSIAQLISAMRDLANYMAVDLRPRAEALVASRRAEGITAEEDEDLSEGEVLAPLRGMSVEAWVARIEAPYVDVLGSSGGAIAPAVDAAAAPVAPAPVVAPAAPAPAAGEATAQEALLSSTVAAKAPEEMQPPVSVPAPVLVAAADAPPPPSAPRAPAPPLATPELPAKACCVIA